jgi:hypothetical protein
VVVLEGHVMYIGPLHILYPTMIHIFH